MGNISTDQKLQLIQMLRAENHNNRMAMRSRERLLYDANPGGGMGTGGNFFPERELYALEQPQRPRNFIYPLVYHIHLENKREKCKYLNNSIFFHFALDLFGAR